MAIDLFFASAAAGAVLVVAFVLILVFLLMELIPLLRSCHSATNTREVEVKRMLVIVTGLGLMLVGFSIAGTVLHFWGPHYAGAPTWAAGLGIVLGLAEVELIGKLSKPES